MALLAATLPDSITFALAGVIVIAGALGVVLAKNPVHSALMLVMTLFGVAVLFVEQDAQFLAAVQVIVYAGAIIVLFLFVIMLIGVDREEAVLAETFRGQRVVAFLLGAATLAEVLLLASGHWATGAHGTTAPATGGAANTKALGDALFSTYLLPFEVTSALLIVAVVGAVVLARRHLYSEGAGPEVGAREAAELEAAEVEARVEADEAVEPESASATAGAAGEAP